ncbi:LamG-like jellyroll fold domain-containing protein [Coraliomargarita algicola]|uniref:LamG-like jellyroll fold domain-containing protein n=1 Tax=Coraliomargarita algicola TaxID=3092156 RepID=A0ABZ0RQY6_9BACT|nr:LamG-like jellyroll fold domain-containing protein [Coraliomargarita sp. J2-16]WPJ97917.1 LamG-like jellyroll fold domain-containing protein [Coraliomargarita sp. J2-16]
MKPTYIKHTIISSLLCLGISAEASLVAHYTFTDNYADISGNEHHAALSGGTGSIVSDIERGSVFNTDGASYLDLEAETAIPHFPANSSITLTAWVKQIDHPGSNYTYILQLGQNGDQPIASLGIMPDGRFVTYSETSQPGGNLDQVNSYSEEAVEATNTWTSWHHLAAVYDRSSDVVTLYVDGAVAGTNSIELLDDSYAFNWSQARIGGDQDGEPYFNGLIDDVRIYDEALSQAEIQALNPVRFLVDFGLSNETTESPDQYGYYWNNFSATSIPTLDTLTNVTNRSGSIATGVTIEITDSFFRASTNTDGSESIYVPAATGDFFYIQRSSDESAALVISGLDPSGDTVYDFKFLVTTNRLAPQSFKTDYTATGLTAASVSLEAVGNINNVASIDGVQPDANGEIQVLVEINENSSDFGALSLMEVAGRAPTALRTPDPEIPPTPELTPDPGAGPNTANPEGLTAYVWETADPYSGRTGAAELLRRAGFHVETLALDQSPYDNTQNPSEDVDLIFIGSFVSESEAYATYMAQYSDDLYNFVDRGGLLVQMAQADQTEPVPPFFPTTQNASRVDDDFAQAHVLSPEHPLMANIPVSGSPAIVEFVNGIGGSYSDNVVWESFYTFFGFEVILAGDTDARYPALMEGAYGQGRIVLAAMGNDKILKNDIDVAPESLAAFNEPFFDNLYTHCADVRDVTAPALEITPQPGNSEIGKGAWSLVLLPDTQVYSQNYPGVFSAQTSWIRQHARTHNIRYVLHLGDIVNNNSIPEWEAARESMGMLDGVVPYAIVTGNHDYGPSGNAATRDTHMNTYFKQSDYDDWTTFGGVMEANKMDNSYHLFEAGGVEWIIIALEWGPRDSTLEWARSIYDQYPSRKGILITHAFVNNNDLRYDITDTANPQNYNPHYYSTPGGVNDGQEIWDKFIKDYNFAWVFNGHVLGDGTGYRVDNNLAGEPVHQMLVNYQMRNLGGEAYMRILEFQSDGETVKLSSYSPLYDNYLTSSDQDFDINLPLGASDLDEDGILDYYDEDYDDDGDGLNNYQEFAIYGTHSDKADSDGDGIDDADEIAIGSNPLDNNRAVVDLIQNDPTRFGLYTNDMILDLNPADMLIQTDGNTVELEVQMRKSPDLINWTDEGAPLQWSMPKEAGKEFYRIDLSNN